MIKTKIEIGEKVVKLVEAELKSLLEKEFDDAIERFNKRKGEVVAGILVWMMKSTDMRILQDRIVFEIRSPQHEEKRD